MFVQAEVSVYRLGEADLMPSIYDFLRALERPGLTVEPGPLSTLVAGESALVFAALNQAYAAAAADGQAVLVVRMINKK